ncbi:MAG: AAA family ATPase [Candidatus Zixiibacteriota bacterium]
MPIKIVITGAPASGKSKFIERLKIDPRFADFVFLKELARQLLQEDPTYRQRWSEFHREIYRRQVAREDQLAGNSFITDRGTADAFAFHPETDADMGTTIENEYNRYNGVIQLESTASLGEPYFQHDDIRNESIEDVLFIEKATTNVWNRHPNYHLIRADIDMEMKYRIFVQTLVDLIRRL